MPKDNIPEIRVRGFSDEWARRKLGDMGSTFTGLSGKTKEDFGHGDAKFITYMNVFSNPIADLQMTETVEIDSKQNCVKAGDVFFTTSSETPEEVGMSCVMPENADNTYLNSFCFGYRPIEKFDLNYLAYVLRSDSFRKEMMFLAQGISRYNISKNKVMEVEIPVPSLEEQSKVGRCFSNLESLISQHQHKHEALVAVKKAMLEKMFPKEGENVPEIRFVGFTDPWEQRKLGEIGEVITGSTPSTQHPEYYSEDGMPWVTPTDIVDNIIYDTPRKLSPIGEKVGRVVPADTILVTCIASIGKNAMLVNTGSFNQQINSLVPDKKKYDPYFLLTESFHWSAKMKREAAAGTMQIVNKNEFSAIETYVPELSEQKAIGAYFCQIDKLITLHQRKCEVLKNLKSALLSKMFV